MCDATKCTSPCCRYAGQISKSIILEAGKYYYITGLQKGTESTDSLSAGVRLPSGRFMRPITKEILQWRMPGKVWITFIFHPLCSLRYRFRIHTVVDLVADLCKSLMFLL